MRSWVFRTWAAVEGEDATTRSWVPSLREMSGPWARAIWASEAWGCFPSWRRLPTTGHGLGPGGRLRFGLRRVQKKKKRLRRGRNMRRKEMSCIWYMSFGIGDGI